mgnify:CR=1 FL=1
MSLNDAVWLIYKVGNENSENPGLTEHTISMGESINDLFIIPDDHPIDVTTVLVYFNAEVQRVAPTHNDGDFYIKNSEIIANKDIPAGSSLAIAFLTDMSTYFGEG